MPAISGQGGSSKVKWAYFGKQKGASGKVHDLGWVRVGSSKWRSYVQAVKQTPVHTPGGQVMVGPHRKGLVPSKYLNVMAGKNPNSFKPAAGPTPVTKGNTKSMVHQLVATGRTRAQARQQLGLAPLKASPPKAPPKAPAQHNQNVLAKQIGSPNIGKMTPMSTARAQANLQFGAQISDTKLSQAEGVAQHAQNLNDIQQWYNQIQNVNAGAQQANQAAVKGGMQQDQGNMLAALRAIGGSANASAGGVAAAGLNQQGLMQGLGQSQDMFSNNLKTMLSADQAGQMGAQSALDSQAARSLQQQLMDLQSQRGNAIVANQDAIRQQNNALAQTRFGNTISKQQAVQAGVALAGNQRLQAQQIAGQHIANAQAAQQLAGGGSSGHTAWAALKPADRYGAVTSAIKSLGTGATPQKVAVMLQSMGGWAPVHTMQFISTFFQ